MGLYAISCTQCGMPFIWFSGNLDQRCASCAARDKYVFITTTTDNPKPVTPNPETKP